jgi:hypothetical protein
MGSAAPANLSESSLEPQVAHPEAHRESRVSPQPEPQLQVTAQALQSPTQAGGVLASPIEKLRNAVLQALADGNQRVLVSMLEAGEWVLEGNEVVINLSESQTVVDMSLGADARRLAIASASGVLGRAVKLRIVPGAAVAGTEEKSNGTSRSSGTNSGAGGRSRAEQDAVVRRLQEKFGAEIRTVIDYKEKR